MLAVVFPPFAPALGKLRITGLLARFDVARSFPQFPRPLLLQPTYMDKRTGSRFGSGRCQPRPHLPIYRMTQTLVTKAEIDDRPLCRVAPQFERVSDFLGCDGNVDTIPRSPASR